jgi:hypothetical protein
MLELKADERDMDSCSIGEDECGNNLSRANADIAGIGVRPPLLPSPYFTATDKGIGTRSISYHGLTFRYFIYCCILVLLYSGRTS